MGSREEIFSSILDRLERETSACVERFEEQLDKLREICYLSGKKISFQSGGATFQGRAQGIGDAGELGVVIDQELCYFAQADSVRVL